MNMKIELEKTIMYRIDERLVCDNIEYVKNY